MGTSTLTSLAELKMHIRGEHQEKSTKIRMKQLFGRRSRNSLPGAVPASQPSPNPNADPEPTITLLTSPVSETSASDLRCLIPDDTADDEPNFIGTEDSISLSDLFDFNNDRWVNLYDGYARSHLKEELAVCELLNQDAATDEGVEVDVDEMTGDILMA